MRICFLADADFNQRIVAGLRRREPAIDCLSAHEGGSVGLSDPEVLQLAAVSDRVLLSHDFATMPMHFRNFLASHESPGLIMVPQELEIGTAIEEIVLIWSASDAEEWLGQIDYLPL